MGTGCEYRDDNLVMLPLGYCEGKPVFVGDELQTMSGCIWVVEPFNSETEFSNSTWPRKEPVMPQWIIDNLSSNLRRSLFVDRRTEIEAYWKALDEFNKGKA